MFFKPVNSDQCIALAALAQAIRSVQNLAWKGQANESDLRAVVASLLKLNAQSAPAIYEGSFELNSGFRVLKQQLDPTNSDKDPEFANLAINLIALQAQLDKDKTIYNKLGEEITSLSEKHSNQEYLSNDEALSDLYNDCSKLYQNTLSKMSLRIQVRGEPKYLKQTDIQDKVRAALLAAVRAIILWRQSGGSRLHFLFKKNQVLAGVKYLIANPVRE